MNEDALYRSSTQFRFWSFTPAKLKDLRTTSNSLATDNIKALVKRRQASAAQLSSADATPSVSDAESKAAGNGAIKKGDGDVDCLTVEEEEELLKFYCKAILELGMDEFHYPNYVVGTAIQYLKRFYLTHSFMDYAPKKIMPSALFLATKTENYSIGLANFMVKAKEIGGLDTLTEADVLSPEFIFTQALRFHFDIKHPFRALKGFMLECNILISVIKGGRAPVGWSKRSDDEIRQMFARGSTPAAFEDYTLKGYAKVKKVLENSAVLSDAYFYYSPSQITFAAWHTHDAAFINTYLELKLTGVVGAATKYKIQDTVKECADLLQNFRVPEPADLKVTHKKMTKCNKIHDRDLIQESKARKRGVSGDNSAEGLALKKRKIEREQLAQEGEALFGPALVG